MKIQKAVILPEHNNKYIIEYLDAYRRMPETDFAVMISGPWGCGKTHFIHEYLNSCFKQSQGSSYLYVSLNGIKSKSEIDARIFQAMHPILGSKQAQTVQHLISGLVQSGISLTIPLPKNISLDANLKIIDNLFPKTVKAKAVLYVFDDFERSLLTPEETLGYIADFLDNGQKVILVGAENEITAHTSESGGEDSAKQKRYLQIREKVIGKTFVLSEDISDLFGVLIGDGRYPKVESILNQNRDALISMFRSIPGVSNYRALKHAFRDFNYLMSKIPNKFLKNMSFCNDFTYIFITLDYEMQIGRLLEKDFGKAGLHINGEPKTEFEKILDQHSIDYNSLEETGLILPNDLLKRILWNKRIGYEELVEALQATPYFINDSTPEWVKLWRWRILDDQEAKEMLEQVKAKIKKSEYHKPEIILHVFSILSGLARRHSIEETQAQIKAQFGNYVKEQIEKGVLEYSEKEKSNFEFGSLGLEYWGNHEKDSDTDAFRSAMAQAVRGVLDKRYREEVSKIEGAIDTAPSQFCSLIAQDSRFQFKPVLHLFHADVVLRKFNLLSPKERMNIIHSVETRYRIASGKLTDEKEFLCELRNRVKDSLPASNQLITPSLCTLQQLLTILDKILPHLEKR